MRYVWITLFCVLLIGLAFGPRLFLKKPHADEELRIISPHWDGIRHEFGRAFAEYYQRKYDRRIEVTWLDVGGTGEIRKYLQLRFEAAKPDEGVGVDVLFGGGMDLLPRMADRNYFEAFPLPPELQEAIPPTVNGLPLRDKDNRYHAACLSSFGFVYNKLVVERAKLPVPQKWEDLGNPEYAGWVSCGDPNTSGSLHQAFEIVLQGYGWERGYTTLGRMLSNVRATNEGGSSIPRDVSLGQAAAGPCIDFYASAPARRQGATHLQLVIPKGVALATPDCIAILRHPPNQRAAREFLIFVMSEPGQRLWYQRRGTEGGPIEYDLERLPVMPAIYERGYETYTVSNPFRAGAEFKYESKKGGQRWGTLNDLWRATILDLQACLWDARKAVNEAGRDGDLGQVLCQPPLSEADILKIALKELPADERNALKNKWSAWARLWYEKVKRAAETNGAVPEFQPAPTE